MNTHLSSSVKVRESHEKALPLVLMASRHKVALQFRVLFQEVNSRMGKKRKKKKKRKKRSRTRIPQERPQVYSRTLGRTIEVMRKAGLQ